MHTLDARVPAACARIRSALAGHASKSGIAPEMGGVIRTLAASKLAGAFLCLGEDVGEIGAWILDGMDPASGLVALVREPHEEAVLERELGRDLRVSVHRQDAESFLIDVHAHRFDLIVDRSAGDHAAVLRLGLGLLRSGGLYLVPHRSRDTLAEVLAPRPAESPGRAPGLEAAEWTVASLGGAQDTLIITRRPTRQVGSRRRRR